MGSSCMQMRTQQVPRSNRARRMKSVLACLPLLTIAMRFRSRGSRAMGLSIVRSRRLEMPPDHHRVSALHPPRGDRRAQHPVRPVRLCHDQQPRRLLVEPVNDSRSVGRRLRSTSGPPRPSSALTSVPVQFPGAGWTTIPAGLSTTSRVLVLVDDLTGMSSPEIGRFSTAGSRPSPRCARLRPVARLFAPPVDEHVALGDQRRRLSS